MSSTNETKAVIQATPTKLDDGSWGAVAMVGGIKRGDIVQITTRAGKTWTTKVEEVGGTLKNGGITFATTESRASRPAQKPDSNRYYAGWDREDCRKYGWDGVVGSRSYYSSGQYDEDS